MVYQGSKNKLAKYIIPILLDYINENNIKTYIEPFVGGCNIIDKIKCQTRIGSDSNKDLIALLKYVQKDNSLSIAPQECSFEHYIEVRADKNNLKYTKEYRALIGYCASYGGRYFDGGYGRSGDGNIYSERVVNLKQQAPTLSGIDLSCKDYKDYLDKGINNALFYLDPPYKGTKQYNRQELNYEEFYDFCRQLSKNNIVVVSEYNMPDDFECIWQKERSINQNSNRVKSDKATEKLFILDKKINKYQRLQEQTLLLYPKHRKE